MKTKAAILVRQRRPLVITDVEVPPVGYGQVLVRVVRSGICGSQLGEIDGVKGRDAHLPHLLGHEGGGVVEETGPGVTRVKSGDHVVLHWRKGTGIESATPKYLWEGKSVNAGWVTTFNEYAVVSENRLTTIPRDVPFEVAALMGCAVTTAFGVIANDARLTIGESIVIFGAGGVGLAIARGASLVSAHPVIAVDIHRNKLSLAKRFGATHAIDATKTDARAEIGRILGGRGADVVVDTTGDVGVIEAAYETTSARGRTILVGVPAAGKKIRISSLPLHFGKRLTGSHGGDADPSNDIPRYLNLIKNGKLRLDGMITDRCRLEDVNTAIRAMRRGEVAGRCVIEIGGSDR